MQRLLFIGLLVALVGGAQAEELINYSEEIGPFVVSFSLPELQSGPVEFEKDISQTEMLNGRIKDECDFLPTPEGVRLPTSLIGFCRISVGPSPQSKGEYV